MPSQDLEDWFSRAAAIAGKVPKNLQEAAFNRALDHLMKPGGSPNSVTPTGRSGRSKPTGAESVSNVLPNIDRTRLPDIAATSRLADRALKVLQLALHEYNHDGLTAGEISEILTKTFRLPAKVNAVGMALARETTTLDLRREGSRSVFHIMQPGEDYLSSLRSGSPPKHPTGRRTGNPERGKVKQPDRVASVAKGKVTADAPKQASKERRKGNGLTGRPGPKAAIERLIGRGYFGSARTISDVRSELKHALGFDFRIQELAISLVRLLRGGQLKRDRNANEQYEYRV
jgi:hypothetical protein